MPFTIIAISKEEATLDFNHPLAGENLNFSVTVRNVQSAGGGRIIVPGEA
jgi:FKBP-type peptidyl-prolyl cis-trans isomerase SlyD